MEATSVTSKGQVTIPKPLRQRLGLRQGSKVEFVLAGDHLEMRCRQFPGRKCRKAVLACSRVRGLRCRRTSTRLTMFAKGKARQRK